MTESDVIAHWRKGATAYAVAARYDDPAWADQEATMENAGLWISRVDQLLSTLLQ